MWMSLARSSTARSRRSLSARTTGAPLARSRRLSMSSSDCWLDPRAPSSGGRIIRLDALVEHGGDVLERGHRDLDRFAEHDFGGANGGGSRRDRRPRGDSFRSAPAPGRSWTRAGNGGKIRRGMASRPGAAAGPAAPRPSSRKPRRRTRPPKGRWLPTAREAAASGLNSPGIRHGPAPARARNIFPEGAAGRSLRTGLASNSHR